MIDRRRYGVIEVRRVNAETYHLTIGGRLCQRRRDSQKEGHKERQRRSQYSRHSITPRGRQTYRGFVASV